MQVLGLLHVVIASCPLSGIEWKHQKKKKIINRFEFLENDLIHLPVHPNEDQKISFTICVCIYSSTYYDRDKKKKDSCPP